MAKISVDDKLSVMLDVYKDMRQQIDTIFNIYGSMIKEHGVIFCGVGKNWYIADELTKIFISFGINAASLDCTHALHGDCGMIKNQPIFFLSKSGTTRELTTLMEYLRSSEYFSKNPQVLVSLRNVENGNANYIFKPSKPFTIYEFDERDLTPTISPSLVLMLLSELGVKIFESDPALVKQYKANHPAGEIGARLTCM